MRRSLSVKIATLLLVASMAAPAFAAARRDDSPVGPIDAIERAISRLIDSVIHICDLNEISPPK